MTRIGIVGYGNLAKGVECAIAQNPDLELIAVFSRRDPQSVKIATPNIPVLSMDAVCSMQGEIDVLILCGGSATDLPAMTPELAKYFHVIDSFDNHSSIPKHFSAVDAAATASGHIALISAGWDPGMFSLNRLYASAILPEGQTYTFWGPGVSQGHSDAVRRIPGVKDARQYTLPVQESMDQVRSGAFPTLSARQMHTRLCYVVAEENADLADIENQIKTMPAYFADYDTTVKFISEEQMQREHNGMPHGGSVIRSGVTGWNRECKQTIEYQLSLESNPQFTASVLVAASRAIHRMANRGITGCQTIFDIAPADFSPLSRELLLKQML